MKTSWVSITGLSLTFLVAACSSDTKGPAGAAGASNGAAGASTAGAGNGTAGTNTGTAGAGNGTAGANTSTAGAGNGTAGGSATAGSTGTAGAGNTAGSGNTAGAGPLPRVVTSAANAYWKTDGMLTEVTTGTADVTVNDGTPAQTWEGFGGAFNEMGWKYLMTLSEADRNLAIKLLFGDDGARFTMGRIPMGASDYAIERYSLNEMAGDTAMANFSIMKDKTYLIPYIKAAQAVRPDIYFWSSPWTPPTWMKSAPFQAGNVSSPFDGGTMKSDDAILEAHANYFVKFVDQYGAEGIKVKTVAPQNEPNFGQNYPSCLWGTDTFVKFIGKFLGPAMKTAHPDVSIMLGTMSNGDAAKDPAIVTAVLGDATAKSFVKMIGLQWGMSSTAAIAGSKASGLPMWQTEHKCGNYPWKPADYPNFNATMAPNDIAYGLESWKYLTLWIKAGVTAYSAWNMVLDTVGLGNDTTRVWPQNALLTVDTTAKKLNLTPTYYVFRHLSQYVQPGAKVVPTTGGDALAFKNPDGKIVTVLYNSGAAKTAIVSAGGKMVSFAMPAAGWATVTSQ
jgi:glucosylceramidase